MKKKIILAENPQFTQFIEQDFPVVEEKHDGWTSIRVNVIGYCNPKDVFECHLFSVEVVKDHDGFVSFIVKGEGTLINDPYSTSQNVWIMRTDDFNKAYDLKNKLDTLRGSHIPNEKQKMPCYGSLQREKDNGGVIHRHDQN